MKHILLILFTISSLSLFAQRKPHEFPVDNTPSDTDAFYTQELVSGTSIQRKIYLSVLKKYYSTDIRLTPIAYVPFTSGNGSNLNEFVIDPNGDHWYIDGDGNGMILYDKVVFADDTMYFKDFFVDFSVYRDSIALADSMLVIRDSLAALRGDIGSGGGGPVDSTRLRSPRDSVLIYYQGGSEIGRDTINVGGISASETVLDDYASLRAYIGSANSITVKNFTYTFNSISYTTTGGLFYRTTSGTENGGTILIADNAVKWQRVWDGVHVIPEWWEVGGKDSRGNAYSNKNLLGTGTSSGSELIWHDGIYNNRDRAQAAIEICKPTGNVIEFGSHVTIYLIDIPLYSGGKSIVYNFNGVTLKRPDSAVPLTTSNLSTGSATVDVTDASSFRVGQYMTVLDINNDLGASPFFNGYGFNENAYSALLISSISGNTITFTANAPKNINTGAIAQLRVSIIAQRIAVGERSIYRNGIFDGNKLNGGALYRYPSDWRINKTLDTGTGAEFTLIENCRFFDTPAENIFISGGDVIGCTGDDLDGSFSHVSNAGTSRRIVKVDKCRIDSVNLATNAVMGHSEAVFTNSAKCEYRITNCEISNGFEQVLGIDLIQVNTAGDYVFSNNIVKNCNSIVKTTSGGGSPMTEREDGFIFENNTFIKCGLFLVWGTSLTEGLTANGIKLNNNIFVDTRFDFRHCVNLDFTGNQVLFDTSRHEYFTELPSSAAMTYGALHLNQCGQVNISGNTFEGFPNNNDTIATAIDVNLYDCTQLKDSTGSTRGMYYEQNIKIHNNKLLGFQIGISGLKRYGLSPMQGTIIYNSIGWVFSDNTIILSRDSSNQSFSFKNTYGIGVGPGVMCKNNTIYQQRNDATQYGIVMVAATEGGGGADTIQGGIVLNNYIYGVSAGSDIYIGAIGQGFQDVNHICVGNITKRGIGYVASTAALSYISGNLEIPTMIGTIYTAPITPIYQYFEMNKNLY